MVKGAQADANVILHVLSIGTDKPSLDEGRLNRPQWVTQRNQKLSIGRAH
jgi:hypothetical protein